LQEPQRHQWSRSYGQRMATTRKKVGRSESWSDVKGLRGLVLFCLAHLGTQQKRMGKFPPGKPLSVPRPPGNGSKNSESFVYDPKLLRKVQEGIPPPYQFCTQDGAAGGPSGWSRLRSQATNDNTNNLDYDVVVCGGTLGIFLATALQMRGHNVCILEAGKLEGRDQEWNISKKDLTELVQLGVLSQQDADDAVTTEFKGCRSAFNNGYERFLPDVLNLGVAPKILIERVAARFKSLGGTIIEQTPLRGVVVSELNGAALNLGNGRKQPITARLVIDSMGNASPISRQQRYGVKPDGICAVVGTCAGGYDKETNIIGDLICTNSQITDKQDQGKMQYFWEAFPVGIGRNGKEPGTSDIKTTYMFTYIDADVGRPSLETIMEDYWDQLPQYQPSIKDPERDLDVHRVLFAFFPTYKDSPLKPKWSRILAVGDASGVQSPLSFGGFGALTRHLGRLTSAISDALENDCLHKDDLGLINAYMPNLGASWIFQECMSVKKGQTADSKFVNNFLASNFEKMDKMGPLDGLAGGVDPLFLPQIVNHVGMSETFDWLGHVGMMGLYSTLDGLSPAIQPYINKITDSRTKFQWRRKMEAWKFGSGNDYSSASGKNVVREGKNE